MAFCAGYGNKFISELDDLTLNKNNIRWSKCHHRSVDYTGVMLPSVITTSQTMVFRETTVYKKKKCNALKCNVTILTSMSEVHPICHVVELHKQHYCSYLPYENYSGFTQFI